MKILYVTTVTSTVNAFLVPHIEQLCQAGHTVAIASFENQPLDPKLTAAGCQFWPMPFSRQALTTQHIASYRAIRQLVKQEGYTLIHTHTPIASFITRLACRHLPVRILYTAHGFHFSQQAAKRQWLLYYPLERLAARWTDGLITMNAEDYAAAQRLPLRQKNGAHLSHGVGFQAQPAPTSNLRHKIRARYGVAPNEQLLIFAAELSPRKNQARLIRLLPALKGLNMKLLLLGNGPATQEYQTLANSLGMSEQVIFAGYQNDVRPFLAAADIAVSSARQEGLPVNIMEALARNLPVVATDIRGHRDLIKPGINGYLYRTDTELIQHLKHLRDTPRPFQPAQVQQHLRPFALPQVKQELQQIYNQVSQQPVFKC